RYKRGGGMATGLVFRKPPKGTQPDYLHPPYASTQKRAPTRPLVLLPQTLTELTGPVFGYDAVGEGDNDLTSQHAGAPLGERIIVGGRVLDEGGRPVPNALVEIGQCSAAACDRPQLDTPGSSLIPNLTGGAPTLSVAECRSCFTTLRPCSYP